MKRRGGAARVKREALAPHSESSRALPPLTAEEERELALAARRGDAAAREMLVRRNLPLVVSFVRQQALAGVQIDEVIQEGNLGLLRAVEKFDPGAGTRFATYAIWWIRAFVWRYLKGARSAVRPKSGSTARADLSLDAPLDEEGDRTYLERIPDDDETPDVRCAAREQDANLKAALEKVRGRVGGLGWDIIHSRLAQDPPETLETVGKRWGLSRERVRQVELQTKRFLRGYLQTFEDGRKAA